MRTTRTADGKHVFKTFFDACYDVGRARSNAPPPARWRRPVIAALVCSLKGHNFRISGYANAHRFSWLDWRIGAYEGCRRCRQRRFFLETKEQFAEVLRIERARWQAFRNESRSGQDAATAQEDAA